MVVIVTSDLTDKHISKIVDRCPIFPLIINVPSENKKITEICNLRGIVKNESTDEFIDEAFGLLFQNVLTLK